MNEIERFERFATQAREARELAAFARATRTLNEAEDVLEPGNAEAERVVAALEAMFLVAFSQDEDEAQPRFRGILRAVMDELDAERADELVEALAESVEDEGVDIRLKWIGEALHGSRPFAEQPFKLCAAVASLGESADPDAREELLTGLSEELGLPDERADELRALVEAALRRDGEQGDDG